jgi:hypothetical protein
MVYGRYNYSIHGDFLMVDIDKLYSQTNSFPVKNRVFTKWKMDVIFGAWWP